MRFAPRICLWMIVGVGAVAAQAADSADLDLHAWQRLPVLDGGRLMPMQSYAKAMVESICGRENPTLAPPADSEAKGVSSAARAAAKSLFPDGKPRKFSSEELLLSWLVEPEKWEAVPFLAAEHKQLRAEILRMPLADDHGRRLRYISPLQAEENEGLARRLQEIAARQKQEQDEEKQGKKVKKAELAGVDRKASELSDAYGSFRQLTVDPRRAIQAPEVFLLKLRGASLAWRALAGGVEKAGKLTREDPLGLAVIDAGKPLQELLLPLQAMMQGKPPEKFSWETTAEATANLSAACAAIDKLMRTTQSAELVRLVGEADATLYEVDESPRIAPALDPAALEADRDPKQKGHPWINLATILGGPKSMMKAYPQAELKQAREAFARVKAAYLDRGAPARAAEFSKAMDDFAAAVRALGEKTTELREHLPIEKKDAALLAATAYPPPDAMNVELLYNRLDPFFWSWLISLVSLALLALAFGAMRVPSFWLGIVVLVAAQGMTLCGFTQRMLITGLLPLTNMFESVVFVALCVALFGLWFTLLPLLWPGLSAAWQLTAAPFRPATAPPGSDDVRLLSPQAWGMVNKVLLVPRLALIVLVFCFLARLTPGADRGYFDLLPRRDLNASLPSLNNMMVWIVGLGVLLGSIYYLPRLAVTLVLGVWAVPVAAARRGAAALFRQAMDRKVFVLVGAAVCFLAAAVAYFAPPTVLHKAIDLTKTRPIVRDNFWLFVHVLTITASYGAGALAWGLSNIALARYLFGTYRAADSRDPTAEDYQPAGDLDDMPDGVRPRAVRLPPPQCATLAGFTYKAMQVAVLLLAAGTILGALWADRAWGRFWSWDAKEVWSLITLLAYMLILHGRHIGWFGNFGLAVSSVLGASFIIMAWYGVNFILASGLHSYGSGAGGQWEVGAVVTLNWIFLALAATRYRIEMQR